jgi:cytidylate kinase
MDASPIVITIDGPAGSGKSTVAAKLAAHLGLPHLNTGLLYRALTWVVLFRHLDPNDSRDCTEVAQSVRLEFAAGGIRVHSHDGLSCFLDLNELKGNPKVVGAVSPVSRHEGLRQELVALQRHAARNGCVAEGRDLGWRILPDATIKIWLIAEELTRFERIAADKGMEVALETIQRDAIDGEHAMKPAPDAIEIDSTAIDEDVVTRLILKYLSEFGYYHPETS